jgi:hypothetical protein
MMPVALSAQIASRKDFLKKVAAMGRRIEQTPSRSHFKLSRCGSVVIIADRREAAQEGLNRLMQIDAFQKRVKRA